MKIATLAAILSAPWWVMPPTAPHTEPVMHRPDPACSTCDVYHKAAKTADTIQRLAAEVEAHVRSEK